MLSLYGVEELQPRKCAGGKEGRKNGRHERKEKKEEKEGGGEDELSVGCVRRLANGKKKS